MSVSLVTDGLLDLRRELDNRIDSLVSKFSRGKADVRDIVSLRESLDYVLDHKFPFIIGYADGDVLVDSPEKEYCYLISYTSSQGVGDCEVISTTLLTTYDKLQEVREKIEVDEEVKNVIIVGLWLLRVQDKESKNE